jgi:hypothetical protein
VIARINDPGRRHVLRAAIAAGGAAAALTSHVLNCVDDAIPEAADQSLELLLRAALEALDAAGVLDGEDDRARLRVALADYIERPQSLAGGRCRICGCTETAACVGVPIAKGVFGNCSWADASRALCSNPACLAQAGFGKLELVS